MFARVKKTGKYQYLQIVENRKEKGKVKQRVIATLGRMDRLQEKDRVQTLIHSLSRFSEKAMLILTGQSDVRADAVKIGPSIIFERLWEQTGIKSAINRERFQALNLRPMVSFVGTGACIRHKNDQQDAGSQ